MSERTPLELRQELARQLATEHGPTIATIFLIAEIDRRKTYVEEGFSSTWDYLRRVFNQSETMIHYRLTCARAVNRFPQVAEPLRSGRLCMTTLATLMEGMNESNCDELLAQALGKSSRAAKKLVRKEKPKHVPKDVMRPLVAPQVTSAPEPPLVAPQVTPAPAAHERVQTEILTDSLIRVHMTVNQDYVDLLKEMRGELSHKLPGAADFEILIECMRIARKTTKKQKGIVDKPRADRVADDGAISQSVKRIVEKRDQSKCQWPSEDGGICGSTYRVQFHHKQDRGKGGLGTPENVIQLCQKHNLLAAEICWGEPHISKYRKQPSATEDLQSQLEFT